ncbi:hypothetical protein LguiB_007128 [Lonicera macranthoides]
MKHIKKEESDTATLKGPCGGHWSVKLGQKENGTFLQDGWQEFIRDNSIREADFLLFTYEGNLCFSAQIFNKSGLERINTLKQLEATSSGMKKKQAGSPRKGSIDHPLKPQQSNNASRNGTGDGIHEEDKPPNGKRKRGRPRKAIVASLPPQQSDLNYVLDRKADGKQQSEASNGKGNRGRPRKCNVAPLNLQPPESSRDDPGSIKHQEAGPSSGKRKPGRPRKDQAPPVKLSDLEPSGHSSGTEQIEERARTIWEPNSQPKGFEEEKDRCPYKERTKQDG